MSNGRCLRVLVVDDQPDVVQLLALLVEHLGHDCRTATSGTEAIRVAGEYRPHLVFMDLGLPDVTGYDVARELRAQPSGHEMVLAALTGWVRKEDHERAESAGFDHHISKPASLSSLRQALEATSARVYSSTRADEPA